MTGPHPMTADPTPGPAPLPAPAPEPLPLADLYSAGFDGEHLKLLRINIHKQLIRAGHDGATVKRALAAFCTAPRARQPLRADATQIDWHGQPAGVGSEKEAAPAG